MGDLGGGVHGGRGVCFADAVIIDDVVPDVVFGIGVGGDVVFGGGCIDLFLLSTLFLSVMLVVMPSMIVIGLVVMELFCWCWSW